MTFKTPEDSVLEDLAFDEPEDAVFDEPDDEPGEYQVFDEPDDETMGDELFDEPEDATIDDDAPFDEPIDEFGEDLVFDDPEPEATPQNKPKAKPNTKQPVNNVELPSKVYRCAKIYGNKIELDKEAAYGLTVVELDALIVEIEKDMSAYEGEYRILKSRIASIYGVIGQLYPPLAAIITCIIRSTLIKSAHYFTTLGFKVHYCDTDSIMVNQFNDDEDYSATLNEMHPWTDIEMKEMLNVFFVGKKTYYYLLDGKIKYGLRNNGPAVWYDWIYYFYTQRHIKDSQDIYDVAYKGYLDMYNRPISDFEYPLAIKSDYRTMTPAAEFKRFMTTYYPTIGLKNYESVMYLLTTSLDKVVFRPPSMVPYERLNIFKMLDNVFATVYNLILFNLQSNSKFYVTVNSNTIKQIMFNAFLDAYSFKFSKKIESIYIDQVCPDDVASCL